MRAYSLQNLLPVFSSLIYLLIGQSTVIAAQRPAGAVTRVYSQTDDVRFNRRGLCKTIRETEGETEERCPSGPNGWPVVMISFDSRSYVSFGRQTRNGGSVSDALDGAFADPHSVIEWRLINGKPFAAIHRYYLGDQQALTIHRLNDNMTSCVAAVVRVQRGRDANAEAIRIADEFVPTFRCAIDKMIIVGHLAQNP